MKNLATIAAAVLACCVVSPQALSASPDEVKSFEHGLNEAVDGCTAAYQTAMVKSQLAEQLAEQQRRNYGTAPDEGTVRTAMKSRTDDLLSCRAAAKDKGQVLYRGFVAKENKPQIREDAKQVYVAWLSYLGMSTGAPSEYQSTEWTDYKRAISVLEADAASL